MTGHPGSWSGSTLSYMQPKEIGSFDTGTPQVANTVVGDELMNKT